jgi:hypothetical protein
VETCGEPGWFTCNKNGATQKCNPSSAQENDCHSEQSEEPWVPLHHHRRLIFLVSPLEVGDLMIALEVPDPCRDLVD